MPPKYSPVISIELDSNHKSHRNIVKKVKKDWPDCNPKLLHLDVEPSEVFVDGAALLKAELEDDNKTTSLTRYVYLHPKQYFRLLSEAKSEYEDEYSMAKKLKYAAPYSLFATCLICSPESWKQLDSITFGDLLCPSLGKLTNSIHIVFKASYWGILSNYAQKGLHDLPMTIIVDAKHQRSDSVKALRKYFPNIEYFCVNLAYGHHHSAMSIFLYDDESVRVVVGSGNHYGFPQRWNTHTQQIWVGPKCDKVKPSEFQGDSPTGFKFALLDYLLVYKSINIATIDTWIKHIRSADFSGVKVALVYSVPGIQTPRRNGSLLYYVGHLLSQHCKIPCSKQEQPLWKIIAETSSIGWVGDRPDEWLTTRLLNSLGSHQDNPYLPTIYDIPKVEFNIIFPTMQNCLDGYIGRNSCRGCIYEKQLMEKQQWLKTIFCKWKADKTNRTKAISYSNSYCRISPCHQKMTYFLLVTSSVSGNGWGKISKHGSSIFIKSFELGVLFLPSFFGEDYFHIGDTPGTNEKVFPLIFDLPLSPYDPEDEPYCLEKFDDRFDTDGDDEEEDSHKIWTCIIGDLDKMPPQADSELQIINFRPIVIPKNLFYPDFKKSSL